MRYWVVFHVYVEGVTGAEPDAVRRLCDAMAARYGLAATELYGRLTRGRLRVKANVDHATANRYARDLETIGARVRIEEARPADGAAGERARPTADPESAPPRRAVRTSPALIPRSALPPSPPLEPPPSLLTPQQPERPSLSTLPPQPEARPSLSTLPPQPEARPSLSTLPPQPASRPTSSPLPPQPASRPVPSTLPPQPASRPTRPSLPPHVASRPSMPALPSHVPSRATRPPLPPHVASRPLPRVLPDLGADGSDGFEATGAAATGDAALHLGALDRSGLLSLAPLDDGTPPASPRSFTPPVPAHAMDLPARPAEPALDRFAPPAAEGPELVVDLADDELAYRARKRLSTPPGIALEPARGTAAPAPPGLGARPASPSTAAGPPPTPRLAPTQDRAPLDAPGTRFPTERRSPLSPRVRWAAGVLLAIVLGFIPAHVVASVREDRAFRAIDARVIEAQGAVDSPQAYEALDAMRASQLDAKRRAHRRIALASLLIWAAAGSAVAYVWFKRVPGLR